MTHRGRKFDIPPGQTKEACPVCGRWVFFAGSQERIPVDPNGNSHIFSCDDPITMHRKLWVERKIEKDMERVD